MSLSPSTLSSIMYANFQAVDAKGSNLEKFCMAISSGVVMSIVGKVFVTVDAGTITGTGTGIGTGITGLSSSSMKSKALGDMSSQGVNADKMMQAIMDAVVTHLMSSATLTTVNAPVFLGTGIVTVGSITVVGSEMGSNIDSQLQGVGAKGKNRTQLAMAIGDGVCTNILSSGTGNIVITGSLTVPPPLPGVGAGTGVIS